MLKIKKAKKNLPVCTKYGYVNKSRITQKYIRKLWDKEMEARDENR